MDQNEGKRKSIICIVVVGIVLLGFILINLMGVQCKLTDTSLKVNGLLYSTTADYSTISSVELRSSLNFGTRNNGMDGIGVKLGYFENSELGTYFCGAYSSCKSCIIVHRSQGKQLVINARSEEKTKELFTQLQQKCRANS